MIGHRFLFLLLASLLIAILPVLSAAQEIAQKTIFHIKYIAQGAVYLDGGRAEGLHEGQKLIVKRHVATPVNEPDKPSIPAPSGVVAELNVVSIAEASAVCEIVSSTEDLQVGDAASIPPEVVAEQKKEERQQRLVGGREYPQLITFNGGDPVQEEARAEVPRPPSPDINRIRGRMGIEYSTVMSRDVPASTSSEIGVVLSVNMTRVAGTHWDFQGYYRGRFTTLSGTAVPATISDLINRTYTLNVQYHNPESPWVAGGGRLYLPWATSLDTIDGGYVGHKIREHVTVGVFAGTTPDPTSYDYNPNGKLAGTLLNYEGGSFDDFHYSTTVGFAIGAIGWQATRQFAFTETSLSYKREWSLYDAMEIDAPHTSVATSTLTGPPTASSTGGLNRSYITLRYQPYSRLELDLNDTYFRDFPTFDPLLIGTGLLDRYLFQGLSGGVRVTLPGKVSVYTDQGQSSRTGDAASSGNQLYGVTFDEVWHTSLRADLRYSKFSSAFGSGDYEAISLSRAIRDNLQWDLQGGLENFSSILTATSQTHFINTYLDWTPGRLLFLQAGYNWQRGGTMNYDQLFFMIGKRF